MSEPNDGIRIGHVTDDGDDAATYRVEQIAALKEQVRNLKGVLSSMRPVIFNTMVGGRVETYVLTDLVGRIDRALADTEWSSGKADND